MTGKLLGVALRVLAGELPTGSSGYLGDEIKHALNRMSRERCADVDDLLTVLDSSVVDCVINLDRFRSLTETLAASSRDWPSSRWYRLLEELNQLAQECHLIDEIEVCEEIALAEIDRHAVSMLVYAAAFFSAESSDIVCDLSLHEKNLPDEFVIEAKRVSDSAGQLAHIFLRYAHEHAWRTLGALSSSSDIAGAVLNLDAADRDARAVLRGCANAGQSLIGALILTILSASTTSVHVILQNLAPNHAIDVSIKIRSDTDRLVQAADLRLAEQLTNAIEREEVFGAREIVAELKTFTRRSLSAGLFPADQFEFAHAFMLAVEHCRFVNVEHTYLSNHGDSGYDIRCRYDKIRVYGAHPAASTLAEIQPLRSQKVSTGDIHTTKRDGKWFNTAEGNERASNSAATKAEAQALGREMAIRRGVEHVIHNQDGTISERNTYPRSRDPRRTDG